MRLNTPKSNHPPPPPPPPEQSNYVLLFFFFCCAYPCPPNTQVTSNEIITNIYRSSCQPTNKQQPLHKIAKTHSLSVIARCRSPNQVDRIRFLICLFCLSSSHPPPCADSKFNLPKQNQIQQFGQKLITTFLILCPTQQKNKTIPIRLCDALNTKSVNCPRSQRPVESFSNDDNDKRIDDDQ